MSVQEGLLTVEDVARRLRLAPYTIRKWVRLGRLPAVRLGDRRIRFMSEAVDRWVREQRI
ncbi:MAG: helix-turn-helix domain-containing protein [Elusimicrobia bacterium]|nr:helix-turn-helix domain-containing protein [Elusimicrobiota bacterium]